MSREREILLIRAKPIAKDNEPAKGGHMRILVFIAGKRNSLWKRSKSPDQLGGKFISEGKENSRGLVSFRLGSADETAMMPAKRTSPHFCTSETILHVGL